MKTRSSLCFCILWSVPAIVFAQPVPPRHAIPARVESSLSAPVGQQSMQMPTDVAIDSTGSVYVADGANDRIVRFSSKGEFLPPFEPGLNAPTGLFVDHKDRLWVANSANHRVLQLDADGKIARALELPSDGQRPSKPTHLLVTKDNARLYVVDNANHRLRICDLKSGKWTSEGAPGKALGQFQYPFMIAAGADGAVHITETIGTRIQTLTAGHQWGNPISGWGIALGQLCRPKGIAVDDQGQIFVSDSTLCAIQAFTPAGKLIGVLTDSKGEVLRFEHPMGMRFDSRGRLYIVELKANRVAIVSLADKPGGAP